jgi:hypothetical protein
MKAKTIVFLLLALVSGAVSAANVHNITWVRKAVSPGTVVTLGGQDFVLVRMPMKEFSNNNRYVVEYLAPVVDPGPPPAVLTEISTLHSNETITDPVTVSGYPAQIEVTDGRSYQYHANIGFEDGLQVDAQVYGIVTIKVGDTLMTLSTLFSAVQQTLTAVATDFSASPYAQWGNYTDPTVLVTSFDNWLDYVRIIKLN